MSFLCDRANLVTLAGLSCGVLAIYFSARGATAAAVIALLWALLCDWFDGPIARRISNRTEADRAFGGQLDSLADVVCSGVGPAALLLSVSNFDPWFLPGAISLDIATANLVFGDQDGRRIYICGDTSLYSVRVKVAGSHRYW